MRPIKFDPNKLHVVYEPAGGIYYVSYGISFRYCLTKELMDNDFDVAIEILTDLIRTVLEEQNNPPF